MTFTLRLSNSGFSAATRPSSVVQTGVKSLGCENSTAQLSPFHSWKLIVPSVVSAVKSGASSPRRMAMGVSWVEGLDRRCAETTLAGLTANPIKTVGIPCAQGHVDSSSNC